MARRVKAASLLFGFRAQVGQRLSSVPLELIPKPWSLGQGTKSFWLLGPSIPGNEPGRQEEMGPSLSVQWSIGLSVSHTGLGLAQGSHK